MGAIEPHTARTVQAHQRLALTSLLVANAKAVRLNVSLCKEGAGDGNHRGLISLLQGCLLVYHTAAAALRGVCSARKRSTACCAAAWCSGSFQCSMSVACGASAASSRDDSAGWCRSLPSNTNKGV